MLPLLSLFVLLTIRTSTGVSEACVARGSLLPCPSVWVVACAFLKNIAVSPYLRPAGAGLLPGGCIGSPGGVRARALPRRLPQQCCSRPWREPSRMLSQGADQEAHPQAPVGSAASAPVSAASLLASSPAFLCILLVYYYG